MSIHPSCRFLSSLGVPSHGCNIEWKVVSCEGERASSTPEGRGIETDQIWVPDVRVPGFKAQAHRQSLAVAMSLQENEDQSFINTVSDLCLDEDAR